MEKIGIISLGCPRNLVDSEVMMGLLKKRGCTLIDEIGKADIAIVNTCAFIKDAVEESLDTIFSLIELKKKKKIKHIIVAGCLAQRYKGELRKELKGVDGFIGTGDLPKIGLVIDNIAKDGKASFISEKPSFVYSHLDSRDIISPRHYAYIKIQEGCANRCSYCIIPQLRGDLRSRPAESIIEEAAALARDQNISELNIIGQDTTSYGVDLYGKKRIAWLIKSLAGRKAAQWIRLLYTHPAHFTEDLIRVISEEPSVCKYVDLPVQHISDRILTKMGRGARPASIRALIEKLRKEIPGLAIRTTVMVGFPGETELDFKKLMRFIKDTRFERLGAFIYSNEEGSRSFDFKSQIPDKVKKDRYDKVMKLQQEISAEYNKSFMGKTIEAMIDEEKIAPGDFYMARSQHDAPSVDGTIFVKGRDLKPGDFVKVRITDTLEYDLAGEAVK